MKNRLDSAWRAGLAAIVFTASVTGCYRLGPPIQEGQPVAGAVGHVVNLKQGWGQGEQQRFYFTSQGSQLMPYAWFMALEQAGNTNRFRAPENLARQRWLVAQPTRLNPDALPVGLVKDVDGSSGRSYVGLTCAACHTAQIEYGTTQFRIDGGPAMADADGFLVELTEALQQTLAEPAKFDRFAQAVLGARYQPARADQLRQEMAGRIDYFQGRLNRNAPHLPYGYARLDAFGNILNEVTAYALNLPANARPANAPVSYPFLWDTPQADRVQWNGVATNSPAGFGAMGRNVGEVLGVFGHLEVDSSKKYVSSAKMINLGLLERWAADLCSPLWPAEYLPPLDPERQRRGEIIYQRPDSHGQSCVTCHGVLNRTDPKRRYNAVMTPLDVVGTDPTMATNFAGRTAATGILAGSPNPLDKSVIYGTNAAASSILSTVGVGVLADQPIHVILGAWLSALHDLPTPQASLLAYKARPLNGIWATAPYLHNGSVPNLWELLTPPEKRVKTFYVGSRQFDPVKVGFVSANAVDQGWLFDTTLPGNSNSGHNYGTGLSDAEKWDLIEHLKSL